MVLETLSKGFTRVFGSHNDRVIKRYYRRVQEVNALEPEIARLSDAELRGKSEAFTHRMQRGESIRAMLPEVMAVGREVMDRAVGMRNILDPAQAFDPSQLPEDARELYEQTRAKAEALEPEPVRGGEPAPGWMQVEIPLRLYEAVRELVPKSKPPFRARPFDVQLIGGMVLHEGKIAEMKTGEGKTIVAPLACYAACLEGMQCHIVTVNDYLVQRDRDWVFPFYYWTGYTVGAIHPFHMQPAEQKREAYECHVVYGTNSEFGFDYLRDNMKLSHAEQVQKQRDFCIVDEIDSILIDEARTPLIISGPAHEDTPRYGQADAIARHLIQKQRDWNQRNAKVQEAQRRLKGLEGDIRNTRDKDQVAQMREEYKKLEQELPELEAERDQFTQYYETELEKKAVHLTHQGVAEAQRQAGVGSFYVGNNMDFPHLLENALQAHVVRQRDKDYVVQNGEVIIVDEFTGRLMHGRQWGDGLHQAVEAKEGVQVKQETQTLATVTIQNFFKLYKRLAGMTGTAATEATEFHEIYRLDVVSIPTNVPVIREDRNDLIFLSGKDKWNAILDDIKHQHDLGRPVLVGTTSVEKSEMLADMLTKRHGIGHEVLNAKQHEREAHIIEHAGELGAVVIATNMAGRGTDIKLQPISREDLVRHWQLRNLLPRQANAEMSDEQIISLAYRHQLQQELGYKPKDVEALDDEDVKLALFRHWVEQDAGYAPEQAAKMSLEQCVAALDRLPEYRRHRLEVFNHVEQMGGLHIIGTERHEARRVDNQLRGRSGRQGDQGSSRFFISLEDDLMKLFANTSVLNALSKLGMKEGDAIEHRMVTRSVERAQRKVEERNYQQRKQLLDYDEVMEHQRSSFYATRQNVLEGRDIDELIFEYIGEAIEDAVGTYLAPDYVPNQVAEWVRANLDASLDPGKVHLDDLEELQDIVRKAAHEDAQQTIEVTIGEYMSNELPPEEWDLRGLQQWAMSRYGVDLKMNRLREMNVDDVTKMLTTAAQEQIDRKDLTDLEKFLAPHYGARDLAAWARNKFGIELNPEEIDQLGLEEAGEQILEQARQAYRRREVRYPVQFIMELAHQGAQQDHNWAADQLVAWANQRYELDWTREGVLEMTGEQIEQSLVNAAQQWLEEGRLEEAVREQLATHGGDAQALAHWMRQRFGVELTPDEITHHQDREQLLIRRARQALRSELTQLERFVLLQILDQAWKDHLYAMDQLKDSIGLRGYAQQDPRIEYKREGSNLFQQMQRHVRDRVTELIFRARLSPNVQLRNVYGEQEARHDEATAAVGAGAAAGQAGGEGESQSADQEAAQRAGSGQQDRERQMSRRQRRAAHARERTKGGGKQPKQRKKKSR